MIEPMSEEIEAKVRIADAEAAIERIEALRPDYLGEWREIDTFFDHPDQRLIEADQALRLRIAEPLDEPARKIGATAQLAYKGSRHEQRMKVRSEHQVAVSEPGPMRGILAGLDYWPMFRYEKRRRKWRVPAAEITLDRVPRIGAFVEVEADSEQRVDEVLAELGLGDAERITLSYVRLLIDDLGGLPGEGSFEVTPEGELRDLRGA